MAETIDSLQIEINAKAVKANDAIDRLVGKLDRLTTSLSRVNGINVDFSQIGNSIRNLATSLNSAPKMQQSVVSMTNAIANLAKSGQNVSVVSASLGSLGNSLNKFILSISSAPAISENTVAFSQAIASLSSAGAKVGVTANNLSALGVGLNNLMTTLSRSPQVSQNVIQMTNALANLASQGSKVSSASNTIVKGLNKTTTATKKAGSGYKGLASYIGKFYATYFMAIRGIKKLWSSIESTADYIEAYNYFNVSLGKIGSDWSHQFEKYGYENAESYAKSFGTRLSESLGKLSGLQVSVGANGKGLLTESGMKNLGLNIQEITQYASQLASVTNSVGQTGETSLAIAKNFTRLAGDISSLFNVDYSSVSKNLQSGLIGQSRALYKYGIDITNATLQTYAYNLGLSKSVSEMTQAEKMQLRMLAILDQSKVSWGDLANTINSPSNMIRQFKNNMKEVGMVMGQLFIPVLQKVLPVINGVSIAFKRLLVDIAGFLNIKIDFDAFGQGYSDIGDELDDSADTFDKAIQKAKEYKNQLLGFDEVTRLEEPTEDIGTDTGSGGIDLTEQIKNASSEYEKVWTKAYNKMENQATTIAGKVEKAFEPLKNIFKYFVAGDFEKSGTELAEWINKGLADYDWGKIGTFIGNKITGTINFASGFANNLDWKQLARDFTSVVNNAIRNINVGALADAINGLLNGIWDFAVTTLETLDWGEFAKKIGQLLQELDWGVIAKIGFTAGALKLAKSMLTTFSTNFVEGFKSVFTGLATNSGISSAISNIGSAWGKGLAAAVPTGTAIAAVISAPIIAGFGIAINDAKAETKRWEEYHQWLLDKMVPSKEWQEKIDEFGSITEGLVQNSNERLKSLGDIDIGDFTVLKNMSDRYFELAEKQNKSVEEMKEFTGLHQTIIDKYPELSGVLDLESNDYKTQREEVDKLIESLEKKAKSKAYEELLVQAYKDQAIAQKNLNDVTNSLNEAQSEYNKSRDEFLRIDKERATMEDEIHQKQLKGIDISKEEEETLIRLQTEAKAADEKYSSMARTVLNLRTESKNAQKVYDELGREIKTYSSSFADEVSKSSKTTQTIVSQGNKALRALLDEANKTAGQMPGIGSNITTGLAEGIKYSWKKVAEAAKIVGGIPSDVIAKMNQIHSPSRLFKQYGKFIDEGLAIGIEDNADRSIRAVRNWGHELQNMATASLPDFSYSSSPTYAQNTVSNNIYNNSEEVALLRQQVSLLQSLLAKDNVVISPDADGIFKMVQGKANNYTMQNGKPAFLV